MKILPFYYLIIGHNNNNEAVFHIFTVGMAVAMLATMAALAPATTPSVGAKEEIDHHFQLFFI